MLSQHEGSASSWTFWAVEGLLALLKCVHLARQPGFVLDCRSRFRRSSRPGAPFFFLPGNADASFNVKGIVRPPSILSWPPYLLSRYGFLLVSKSPFQNSKAPSEKISSLMSYLSSTTRWEVLAGFFSNAVRYAYLWKSWPFLYSHSALWLLKFSLYIFESSVQFF